MLLPEPGWNRSVPVVALQVLELAGAHQLGIAGVVVIVTEHVEHAVHDEQGQLVVERAGVRRRLLGSDAGTDDDVAEEDRHTKRWVGGARIASFCGEHPVRHAGASRRFGGRVEGNESTSVGPSWPRCSRLRAAISSWSTNVSVSSPWRPSSSRAWRASSVQRSRSTSTSSCSSAPTTTTVVAPVGLGGSLFISTVRGVAALVRGDDVGDDAVTDDVGRREVHEGESLDAAEDSLEAEQAALAIGNVDLRHVAGDDDA